MMMRRKNANVYSFDRKPMMALREKQSLHFLCLKQDKTAKKIEQSEQ